MERHDTIIKRDVTVSMTKGVAIILMVLAHSHFSHYGNVFINMFHMPLFFFMSGYCFKESYLCDFKGFSWKRIKGAYWPFVMWGLLFLLLHNFFYSINIYNGEFGYRGLVSHTYSLKDISRHAFRIISSMNDAEQLLGGYWFLHSYFFASFIAFAVIGLCRGKSLVYCLFGCGILLIICILTKYYNSRIPHYIRDFISAREFLAAFFIIVGFCFKHYTKSWERFQYIIILLGMVLVVIGSFFWPCAMQDFAWWKTLPYAITAIAGTLMVFSLCKLLTRFSHVSSALRYVGDSTLAILTWHFLCFKLASLLIIHVHSLPITRLAEFPVIDEFSYRGWWVLYLIIGIALPLIINYCMKVLSNGLRKVLSRFGSHSCLQM